MNSFWLSCALALYSVQNSYAFTGNIGIPRQTHSALFATPPVGPIARAKKAMDPKEYNRVVEERMKKSGMSKEEAEADYNSFLENPPFYYALEKKVSVI